MDAKYLAEIQARVVAYQHTLRTGENAFKTRIDIEKYAYSDLKELLAEVERLTAENATLRKALELAIDRALPESSYSVKQAITRDLLEKCARQAQEQVGRE